MNAREYFDEVAVPIVAELKERPDDRAFIMAAAIITSHLADWIAAETGESITAVRKAISEKFSDFKYVVAVANAHKHKKLKQEGEFKGLTDPLTPAQDPQRLITSDGKVLVLADGKTLKVKGRPPMYEFADGKTQEPHKLLAGAIEAMKKEVQ